MKKRIIFDMDINLSAQYEGLAHKHEIALELEEKIDTTQVFLNYSDCLDYISFYQQEVGLCFIKINENQDLVYLKKLKALKTEAVFVVFTENINLSDDLNKFSHEKMWVHATARSDEEIDLLVSRALKFAFTDTIKMVEMGDNFVSLDSILYVETYKRNRNYLRIVLPTSEGIVKEAISHFFETYDGFIRFGHGLLVNKKNIRRVEDDSLSLCFEKTTERIRVLQTCKKQLKVLMRQLKPKILI